MANCNVIAAGAACYIGLPNAAALTELQGLQLAVLPPLFLLNGRCVTESAVSKLVTPAISYRRFQLIL